jgi:hypothetical protein
METNNKKTGHSCEPRQHEDREIPDMAGDDSHVPLLGLPTAIVWPQVLHSATPQGNKLRVQQANLESRVFVKDTVQTNKVSCG